MLVAFATMMLGAGPANAQVEKQKILEAVQAAFATWEQVDCTNLKFEYKGELDPFVPEKEGALVVYFGNDNLTWVHGTDAYYTTSTIGLNAEGNITKSSIGMNARDIKWSIGAQSNHIDIQTAVAHLIPAAIGFYVGSQPIKGSLPNFITYNEVNHTLLAQHEMGAQYTYFDATGQCTRPDEPPVCGEAVTPVDAGIPEAGVPEGGLPAPIQLCIHHSDPNDKPNGMFYSWTTQPIPYYVYIPSSGWLPGSTGVVPDGGTVTLDTGTTPTGDGGVVPTGDGSVPLTCTRTDQCGEGYVCTAEGICVVSGGDDGCCRISHTREENIAYSFLLVFGLGLFIWRRRRQRHS
ncbi:MAG: hypothetical protein JRH20_01950 [Deltaproteobacteria bacterium]|nr:hypothetical protein [Deltaproteobacteria bacterium]